jgi:hypothetical protein
VLGLKWRSPGGNSLCHRPTLVSRSSFEPVENSGRVVDIGCALHQIGVNRLPPGNLAGRGALPKSADILARPAVATGGAAFIVDHAGRFPTFCAVAFRNESRAAMTWIDFWAVNPCGDPVADYARGQRYADEAIWHVHATGQPVFIECVLIFMSMKLRHRDAGELERGFVDRIANEFPHAMDEVIFRLSRRRLEQLS